MKTRTCGGWAKDLKSGHSMSELMTRMNERFQVHASQEVIEPNHARRDPDFNDRRAAALAGANDGQLHLTLGG
jgi:hypothetical protein